MNKTDPAPVTQTPANSSQVPQTELDRPCFKSIIEFTDAELRNELHRRAMLVLGDQLIGVSLPRPECGEPK